MCISTASLLIKHAVCIIHLLYKTTNICEGIFLIKKWGEVHIYELFSVPCRITKHWVEPFVKSVLVHEHFSGFVVECILQ